MGFPRIVLQRTCEKALDQLEAEWHSENRLGITRAKIQFELVLEDGRTIFCTPTMGFEEPLDDGVRAMFEWRDSSTDHYGDDLEALLRGYFTDPMRPVPDEHRKAAERFHGMTDKTRNRLIRAYVRGTRSV